MPSAICHYLKEQISNRNHFEATRRCTIWVFLLRSVHSGLVYCLVAYMQSCSSDGCLRVCQLLFMYFTLTAEWFNRICQHLRKWKSFFWRGVRVRGGSLWMESSMISCPDVNNWRRARLTRQNSKSPPPTSHTQQHRNHIMLLPFYKCSCEMMRRHVVTNNRDVASDSLF